MYGALCCKGCLIVIVELDVSGLNDAVDQLIESVQDDETLLEIHQLLADMADPYVPYKTGALATNIEVTPQGVVYKQRYAEDVYDEKVPHNPAHHPLATDHWGEAMLRDRGEEFAAGVEDIIMRKLNERS